MIKKLFFLIFSLLFVSATFFSYVEKSYAFTSCQQQPCCNGTDTDPWESASGEKVSSADISCSGSNCTAVLHLPNSGQNAIVWSGAGVSCNGNNWCATRPFSGNTYTLNNLQKGGGYDVKVSTSNSSGNIVSGYGAEYPNGSCHFDFTAEPPPPTPTNTPPVTPTFTPSPTPSGPPQTTADVTFHVEGIDSNNIPNVIPKPGRHGAQGWPFTISVYSGSTLVKTYTDTAIEITDPNDPLYGAFQNHSFKMTGLASGTYKFYVQTFMGSLRAQIGTGTFAITGGQNIPLVIIDPNNPSFQGVPFLTTGDINGDNTIDATDYSILHDCYGLNYSNYATNTACKSDHDQLLQQHSFLPSDFLPGDLNDNGQVDGIDYNTLLRGLLGNSIGA